MSNAYLIDSVNPVSSITQIHSKTLSSKNIHIDSKVQSTGTFVQLPIKNIEFNNSQINRTNRNLSMLNQKLTTSDKKMKKYESNHRTYRPEPEITIKLQLSELAENQKKQYSRHSSERRGNNSLPLSFRNKMESMSGENSKHKKEGLIKIQDKGIVIKTPPQPPNYIITEENSRLNASSLLLQEIKKKNESNIGVQKSSKRKTESIVKKNSPRRQTSKQTQDNLTNWQRMNLKNQQNFKQNNCDQSPSVLGKLQLQNLPLQGKQIDIAQKNSGGRSGGYVMDQVQQETARKALVTFLMSDSAKQQHESFFDSAKNKAESSIKTDKAPVQQVLVGSIKLPDIEVDSNELISTQRKNDPGIESIGLINYNNENSGDIKKGEMGINEDSVEKWNFLSPARDDKESNNGTTLRKEFEVSQSKSKEESSSKDQSSKAHSLKFHQNQVRKVQSNIIGSGSSIHSKELNLNKDISHLTATSGSRKVKEISQSREFSDNKLQVKLKIESEAFINTEDQIYNKDSVNLIETTYGDERSRCSPQGLQVGKEFRSPESYTLQELSLASKTLGLEAHYQGLLTTEKMETKDYLMDRDKAMNIVLGESNESRLQKQSKRSTYASINTRNGDQKVSFETEKNDIFTYYTKNPTLDQIFDPIGIKEEKRTEQKIKVGVPKTRQHSRERNTNKRRMSNLKDGMIQIGYHPVTAQEGQSRFMSRRFTQKPDSIINQLQISYDDDFGNQNSTGMPAVGSSMNNSIVKQVMPTANHLLDKFAKERGIRPKTQEWPNKKTPRGNALVERLMPRWEETMIDIYNKKNHTFKKVQHRPLNIIQSLGVSENDVLRKVKIKTATQVQDIFTNEAIMGAQPVISKRSQISVSHQNPAVTATRETSRGRKNTSRDLSVITKSQEKILSEHLPTEKRDAIQQKIDNSVLTQNYGQNMSKTLVQEPYIKFNVIGDKNQALKQLSDMPRGLRMHMTRPQAKNSLPYHLLTAFNHKNFQTLYTNKEIKIVEAPSIGQAQEMQLGQNNGSIEDDVPISQKENIISSIDVASLSIKNPDDLMSSQIVASPLMQCRLIENKYKTIPIHNSQLGDHIANSQSLNTHSRMSRIKKREEAKDELRNSEVTTMIRSPLTQFPMSSLKNYQIIDEQKEQMTFNDKTYERIVSPNQSAEITFKSETRDNEEEKRQDKPKSRGRLHKIRGNQFKFFTTNYTQDGRKFTQSLVKAVLMQDVKLIQALGGQQDNDIQLQGFESSMYDQPSQILPPPAPHKYKQTQKKTIIQVMPEMLGIEENQLETFSCNTTSQNRQLSPNQISLTKEEGFGEVSAKVQLNLQNSGFQFKASTLMNNSQNEIYTSNRKTERSNNELNESIIERQEYKIEKPSATYRPLYVSQHSRSKSVPRSNGINKNNSKYFQAEKDFMNMLKQKFEVNLRQKQEENMFIPSDKGFLSSYNFKFKCDSVTSLISKLPEYKKPIKLHQLSGEPSKRGEKESTRESAAVQTPLSSDGIKINNKFVSKTNKDVIRSNPTSPNQRDKKTSDSMKLDEILNSKEENEDLPTVLDFEEQGTKHTVTIQDNIDYTLTNRSPRINYIKSPRPPKKLKGHNIMVGIHERNPERNPKIVSLAKEGPQPKPEKSDYQPYHTCNSQTSAPKTRFAPSNTTRQRSKVLNPNNATIERFEPPDQANEHFSHPILNVKLASVPFKQTNSRVGSRATSYSRNTGANSGLHGLSGGNSFRNKELNGRITPQSLGK